MESKKTEINIDLSLKKPIHPKQCPSHIILSIQSSLHEHTIEDLACLNSLLKKVGIELNLKTVKSDGYEHNLLRISIDSDTYINRTTRHAGRCMDANKHGRYKECSVMEFKEMLDTMKHREIIAELKCPRATFYRILKNLRELDDWDNNTISIWFYTA